MNGERRASNASKVTAIKYNITFFVYSDFDFEHRFTDGNCYPVMGLEVDTSVPPSCSQGNSTYTVTRGYV
jgi:hypothetical protein